MFSARVVARASCSRAMTSRRSSDQAPSVCDDELLLGVCARDPRAVEQWYRLEHPRVWRRCLGLVGSRADADDLAQDAMLKLHDELPRRSRDVPYAAWSARVVVNLCRDRWRRGAARERAENAARVERRETPLPDPSEVLSQTELRDLVTELLAKLPAREREAFVLRELEQLSTEQVALAMDVEESTVRSLTTLARRRMRELLAPHVEREARDA